MLRDIVLFALVCAVGFGAWLLYPQLRARLAPRTAARATEPQDREQVAERLAGLGSWVHELRDNRLRWSDGTFRLFGVEPSAGEPSPRDFFAAIEAADRQRWREALRKAVREGQEMKVEFRYRRPDGQVVWIRMALRPEPSPDRVARMSGIVQDISGMRAMQRQLAASEAKFRDLTQLSSDWVWETDARHRLAYLSDSIDTTLGDWVRDLIGREPWNAPEFDFLSPAWDHYRALVQAHKPIDGFEHSQIAPDGRVFHLQLNGRPVFDSSGAFAGYRGTGRNITRERQQRLLLELEGEIAAVIRDDAEPARAVREIVAALCKRLGWIGGVRLARAEQGLVVCEHEGSPAFQRMVDALPPFLACEASAPELHVLDTGRLAWFPSLDGQPELRSRYLATELGARAALLAPIADDEGGADSLLLFLSPVGFSGDGFVGPIADTLSRTLSLYLRRARAELQLRHASMHDALTGLPNRASLLRTLGERLAAGSPLAVLYIDLDRYKIINDTLGHAAGDRALVEIAERLRGAIRPHDVAARMGGDEFVVMLAGALEHAEIEGLARGILAAIEKPLLLADRAWLLSASIGVAVAPADAREVELLLRCADNAMYEVKSEGRNDVRFFSGRLSDERAEQLQLAAELPLALERGEVELYYQPVLAIGERSVVCIEALLRWQHPERGLLLPERFLPAAEQSQLIREVGLWALRRALDDRVRLGVDRHPDIAVSVNVSPRQLVDEEFVVRLGELLEERRLPPHLLRIELTESALVADPERTAGLIDRLRRLGVKVVIDNFGTGYASLSWLKRLPVDGLKIDRAFVHGLPGDQGNAAIVEALTTMAARLGIQAMAEGVETAAELRGLRALDCDQVQGALIADPMPIDEIEDFLETLPALRRMHLAPVRRAQS
ncbi:EAL domain-containing protein [Burkholderiaceae bacterium FT117]|uniref:sensor domain-containing protein n=1 Tax=Zeimonas sediminis TaxID=2944268 RepID=UPI002342F038|nr:EAL domain-containing protein [Zeimonas sediminis]MCM5569503.1 EAL domain-containing protein [Zeimonas sediminis]